MTKALKLNDIVFILVSVLCLTFHWWINSDYIFTPLSGDEWYYAYPLELKNFNQWSRISFGHPPLWNFLVSLFAATIGFSTGGIHLIGFLISAAFLAYCLYYFHKKGNTLLGVVLAACIYSTPYFIRFSAHAHPIILGTFLGVLAIIHNDKRNNLWPMIIFSTLALLTRESLLVILPAMFLAYPKLKNIKYYIPQCVLIGACYLWAYIVQNQVLLNSSARWRINRGQSVLTFSWKHFIEFYEMIFIRHNSYVLIFLLGLVLCLAAFKKSFKLPKISQTFLLAGLFHSLFFAFYTEHSERDHFISTVFFYFGIASALAQNTIVSKKFSVPALISIGVFAGFKAQKNYGVKKDMVAHHLRTSKVIEEVVSRLQQLIKQRGGYQAIMTSGDFVNHLKKPYMGYIDQGMNHVFSAREDSNRINADIVVNDTFYNKKDGHVQLKEYATRPEFKRVETIEVNGAKTTIHLKEKSFETAQ